MEGKIRRQKIYRVVMIVILTVVITFMVTTIVMYNKFNNLYASDSNTSNSTNTSNEYSLVQTLQTFKTMINQLYIGDIDEESMLEGAIKGYVEGLGDPYTEYLTKEEMEEFTEETNSEYVGIGVYVGNDTVNNTILVVGVMKSSPAEEAGIQIGDVIEKIDGVAYTGEQLDEATKVLKAEEGTTATLTIRRDNEEKELTVVRRKITVQHVASEMLENNIAYIQIDSFDANVASNFEEQITSLMNNGATGIIIDLRNNGGGIVDEATGIADLFLDKGETILITKSKKENNEEETKSERDPIVKDIPVVILVNEATASASEILAGALKDNYGATIIGKQTYGKGVIQTLYTLTDGSGIKITTEEYYTPNHNQINEVGITPDIEVDITENEDTQLQRAIEVLLGTLSKNTQ